MAERDSGQPESVAGSGSPGHEVGATSFLQRAVIRRRVRFLHRRRELALYDLGGFLFESHRLGQPHEEILTEKLEALTALDDELALLQRALGLHEEVAVLSEPGIAACSHCGTLRDSAANFCPGCGRPAAETAPLAARAATAGSEPEDVFAAVPEATLEVPAADISAGQETEIAAAEQDEAPAAAAFDGALAPDVTAEMPAVRLIAAQDPDSADGPDGQWAHEPAPQQADEPADEPTPWQTHEPAHEQTDEPTPWQTHEPAHEQTDEPTVQEAHEPPGHQTDEPTPQQAEEPAGAGQGDDASTAAADAPS
jgi:hypothetical protein